MNWTTKDIRIIKDNIVLPDKKLAELLNRSVSQVKQFRRRHKLYKLSTKFKKGCGPWNTGIKGSTPLVTVFKPGHKLSKGWPKGKKRKKIINNYDKPLPVWITNILG